MKYASKEALRDAVTQNGNVITVRAGDLRDAFGYDRLGINVRAEISKGLKSLGIAHYPAEMPDWQEVPVRLYRMGTPVADIIDAVVTPSKAHDDELTGLIGGNAAEILNKIRALVCQ